MAGSSRGRMMIASNMLRKKSMLQTNRREFLLIAGGMAAAAAVNPAAALAVAKTEDFEFIFVTDTHLEPELDAAHGCHMAFDRARAYKADFVLQGGDHVFDTEAVTKERAHSLFSLYDETEQVFGLKVHHTCGNHDCFGITLGNKVNQSDPEYGKKLFEEKFGPARYSFDHKGVHFLVLDSVKPKADATGYTGHIDDDQLEWIAADLEQVPAGMPVIASIHIPLVTAFDSYVALQADRRSSRGGNSVDNSDRVIKIFDQHNVIGVLQGHTHIWEQVTYHGVPYVTGGAVCGNWWKGTRMGTPEGFNVVRVENGKMTVRYETYGFKSVAPQNT